MTQLRARADKTNITMLITRMKVIIVSFNAICQDTMLYEI